MEDKDKRFAYFVMSHTVDTDRGRQFIWPIEPDPTMGKDFCEKIKREHDDIRKWMRDNPDKVTLAEHGFYLDKIQKCCWLHKCASHRCFSLNECYGDGNHPGCYAGPAPEGPAGRVSGPGLRGLAE